MVIGQIDWSSGQCWSTPRARAPPTLRDVAAPPTHRGGGQTPAEGLFHRFRIIIVHTRERFIHNILYILIFIIIIISFYFSHIFTVFLFPFVLHIIIVYHLYKIFYFRSSVTRPHSSRLTFRKIKTRIVGCKTPRRCQEITAICYPFVVLHKHTSYTTMLLHHPSPTTNAQTKATSGFEKAK